MTRNGKFIPALPAIVMLLLLLVTASTSSAEEIIVDEDLDLEESQETTTELASQSFGLDEV